MKNLFLILKGAAMGAANVIPGVSGGTIALITGIFEELINSIKSIDAAAIKLLLRGKIKEFGEKVNFKFLLLVFIGVGASIVSLAKLLEFLFAEYPIFVWAFFFGLILASVYYVGRTITKVNIPVVIAFLIGVVIAVGISFLNPASENDGFVYLIICGVVAICSMILPGLSGSFVLILMGNYELIVIDAVTGMRFEILLPVMIGAGVGLILFSHLLSYLYKNFKNQTIAVLTGFILGSLNILWPWKKPVYKFDALGNILTKDDGEQVIQTYQKILPEAFDKEVLLAIAWLVIGVVVIMAVEFFAAKSDTKE